MKKIILIRSNISIINIIVCCVTILACAPKLEAQTKPNIWRQSYIETGREMRADLKEVDCSKIENNSLFKWAVLTYDTTEDLVRKEECLIIMGKTACPISESFLKNVILTSTIESLRLTAIRSLGWIGSESSFPFLWERAHQPNISALEKVAIGSMFSALENYDSAEQILNLYCYTTDVDFCSRCVWAYYKIGNKSAENYFRYQINNNPHGGYVSRCAQLLAHLGDEENSLPIFKSILDTTTSEMMKLGALSGLGSLDSYESEAIIRKYTSDTNPRIKKEAETILIDKQKRASQMFEQKK